MNKKKGSAIVEATMIFPLVIAAVLAILYIIIGMFMSLSLQSYIHLSLRNEAGRITETVIRSETPSEFEMEKNMQGFNPVLAIEKERRYKTSNLFMKKITRVERGRVYIIDEAELVRRVNLAKEVFVE